MEWKNWNSVLAIEIQSKEGGEGGDGSKGALEAVKGEQGWRSRKSTCGLSLLLVLVHAPTVFLQVLRLFSLHKNQHSKFQFDLQTVDKKNHLVECPLLNPHFIICIPFDQII